MWVRSEPDPDGTWHNALIFRRNVRAHSRDMLIAGVEWHLPPGIALQRAQELDENERVALLRRAFNARAPLI